MTPRTILIRLAALAVTCVAVWIIGRDLDWPTLSAALREARWGGLALASGLAVAHLCLRGVEWSVVMGPVPGASTFTMIRYTVAGAVASLIAPFRTGEALRPLLLRRNHGVPLARSAGVFLADKLLEGLTLGLVVSPLTLLGRPVLPRGPRPAVLAAMVGGAVVVMPLAVRVISPRLARAGFATGLEVFRRPGRFGLAVGVSLVAWLLDAAVLATTLSALRLPYGLADLVVLLLSVNAALLLPSAPGNIGSVELGATVGAVYLGVPRGRAVAFALVYHAVQLAPLLLIGATGVLRVLLRGKAGSSPASPGGSWPTMDT